MPFRASTRNPSEQQIVIFPGHKFGLLTVGDLVFDVVNHPKFLTTPQSYVSHGRLRECECECGEIVLYSENALIRGGVKSCGCLRRKHREKQHAERAIRDSIKTSKNALESLIKRAQYRLKTIQATPSHLRNKTLHDEAEWVGARLRKLFALKGYAKSRFMQHETLAQKVKQIQGEYFVSQP